MNAAALSSQTQEIDRHFASFIARHSGAKANPFIERITLAAQLLSQIMREGHICLDLRKAIFTEPKEEWPSLAEWVEALESSHAVTSVPSGSTAFSFPTPETPLVLDREGRLYLQRYYQYELSLAAALRSRCGSPSTAKEGQEAAIENAKTRSFSIISGGPGTGKTTTVVNILAQFLTANPNLRIGLAAPTGKAASRMEEALREGFEKDPTLQPFLTRLPRARTLDGLLGSRPGSTQVRFHAENLLPVDLLVVDEASMVALPLMAKLFAALPSQARLILLGDRDQLASVAPGNVLADIAAAASTPNSPLYGSLTMLRKNYRFGNESPIYQFCEQIREGRADEALKILRAADPESLTFNALPQADLLPSQIKENILKGYTPYLLEKEPLPALKAFAQFRLLTAIRSGPYGVEGLNETIEQILFNKGLIKPGAIYPGMPILVTENDATTDLRNGDIGLLLPDPSESTGSLWAWFPGDSGVRRFPIARLPQYEKAFAMTIHKSQGSEFTRVMMLLPDRDLPLLTRELIYTGVTRARKQVDLWADAGLLSSAINRSTDRATGLYRHLVD